MPTPRKKADRRRRRSRPRKPAAAKTSARRRPRRRGVEPAPPAGEPPTRPTAAARLDARRQRQLRPGRRRVAGQGQDDQQVPRLAVQGAGQLRPRPRPGDRPQAGRRGSVRHQDRRGVEAPLPRGRRHQGEEAQGPPHPAGHPRRTRRRPRQGRPRAAGQRPGPRGRVDRLAHRRRAEPRPGHDVPHPVQRDHQERRAAGAGPGREDQQDRVQAQEARRAMDRVVGLPAVEPARRQGDARPECRPGAVGRGQADRGPRARDRGVQDRGVLEDHGAAGPAGVGRRVAGRPEEVEGLRQEEAGRATRRADEPDRRAGAETADATATAAGERRRPACRRRRRGRSWPNWRSGTAPTPAMRKTEARRRPRSTRRAGQGVPFVVTKIEQKDRQRAAAGAVHHVHAPAAGEPAAAVPRQPDDADRPEALRGRAARQRGDGRAHHLHADRQHPDQPGRADAPSATTSRRPTATAYLPEKPNVYASGKSAQEAPRGDPPDGRDHDPAEGRAGSACTATSSGCTR